MQFAIADGIVTGKRRMHSQGIIELDSGKEHIVSETVFNKLYIGHDIRLHSKFDVTLFNKVAKPSRKVLTFRLKRR